MTEPLFVVSTFKVKEGRVDDVRKYYKKVLEIIEPKEPQLIAFHGFLGSVLHRLRHEALCCMPRGAGRDWR